MREESGNAWYDGKLGDMKGKKEIRERKGGEGEAQAVFHPWNMNEHVIKGARN